MCTLPFLTGPILAGTLVLGLGASSKWATPEEFADRWVKATREADEAGLRRLFREDGHVRLEAVGRNRELKPQDYAELFSTTLKEFKDFRSERGAVEVFPGDGAGVGSVIEFTVTDRIETLQGFHLEAVQKEVFEIEPGESGRVVKYRSSVISLEVISKPEPWMNYGGPSGLNGYLIETHFRSAPKGMGLVIAGAAVAIALLLKVLHSLGIKRRF